MKFSGQVRIIGGVRQGGIARKAIVAISAAFLFVSPVSAQDLSYRGLYAGMSVEQLAAYVGLPNLRGWCHRHVPAEPQCAIFLWDAELRPEREFATVYAVLESRDADVVQSVSIGHHMPDTLVARRMFELLVAEYGQAYEVIRSELLSACDQFAWIDSRGYPDRNFIAFVRVDCVPMMDGERPRLSVSLFRP